MLAIQNLCIVHAEARCPYGLVQEAFWAQWVAMWDEVAS